MNGSMLSSAVAKCSRSSSYAKGSLYPSVHEIANAARLSTGPANSLQLGHSAMASLSIEPGI
jgi:hypothetical protein